MATTQRSRLGLILDGLLPGDDDWPSAGSLGLESRVRAMADMVPGRADLLAELLAAAANLPQPPHLEEALHRLEQDHPEAFSTAVVLAYNAYYTDPRLLQVLEARTGYEARPPQPLGYELEPFDESMLAKVRQREPFYRTVPGETACHS